MRLRQTQCKLIYVVRVQKKCMIVHVKNLFSLNLLKQNKENWTKAQDIFKAIYRQRQQIGLKQQRTSETIFAIKEFKPQRKAATAASAWISTCSKLTKSKILNENISNMVTAEDGVKYLEIPDKSENDKKHYK